MTNLRIFFCIYAIITSIGLQNLIAMHSKFLNVGMHTNPSKKYGDIYFQLFQKTLKEIEENRSAHKDIKRKLKIKSLEYLLWAAESQNIYAIDYLFKNDWPRDIIRSMILNSSQKSNYLLPQLINDWLDEQNSFAAKLVLDVIMHRPHYDSQKFLELKFLLIENPWVLHDTAIYTDLKKNNIEEALENLDRAIDKGFLPSLRKKAKILYKLGSIRESIDIRRQLAELAKSHDMSDVNKLISLLVEYPQFAKENEYEDRLNKVVSCNNLVAMASLSFKLIKKKKYEDAEKLLKNAQESEKKKSNPNKGFLARVEANLKYLENRGKELSNEDSKQIVLKLAEGEEPRFKKLLADFLRELENLHDEEQEHFDDKKDSIILKQNPKPVKVKKKKKKNPISEISITNEDPVTKNEGYVTIVQEQEQIHNKPTVKDVKENIKNHNLKQTHEVRTFGHKYKKDKIKNKNPIIPKVEPIQKKIEQANSPFLKNLGGLFLKERKTVKDILEGNPIKSKYLRKFLNILGVGKASNTRGSHNKITIKPTHGEEINATIIRSHKGSSPYANTKQLRKIFNELGVFDPDDLWDY